MKREKMSRTLELMFEHSKKLFRNILPKLKNIPLDISLMDRANAALIFMADDLDGGLPNLPLPVIKLIHKKFSDFIVAYTIYEFSPFKKFPEPSPNETDAQILSFAIGELLPKQELLPDKDRFQ